MTRPRAGRRWTSGTTSRTTQTRRTSVAGAAATAGAAASAPASGGNTDWAGLGGERPPYWDRLTPEVQKKVLSLPPDERRPFLQKLREERERRQREAQSQ